MSQSQDQNSSKKSRQSNNNIKSSENEGEEQINPEEEISEDKYQLQQEQNSSILSNKLIQLLQECLLAPVNKFNDEIFIKYDREKIIDKESLEQISLEINNFKMSFIDEQYKIIKELITKYDLINNIKKFSEEKNFAEELNKYEINSGIISFMGPLSNIINKVNKKEISNDSFAIEKFLFKILELNYYTRKTALLEENIKILDTKIEDLRNKNNIL